MMTSTQAERLVRRITDLLTQPALESQAAKLAQDYADAAKAELRIFTAGEWRASMEALADFAVERTA